MDIIIPPISPHKKRGPYKKKPLPVSQSRRTISRYRNKVKNALNDDTIEVLSQWVKTYGIEKYIREMEKLEGKEYHAAYSRIVEHFMPKLQKTETTMAIAERVHLIFTPAIKVCPHCGRSLYEDRMKVN